MSESLAAAPPGDIPQGPILLVDDSPLDRHLLHQLLRRRGFRVQTAANGEEAFARMAEETPDLILLDIQMPDMDGFELCSRLKADPDTALIPVMFISAASGLEERIKAFELGGVDYLSKPIQAEEVQARVSTHLALYDLRRSLERRAEERAQELAATRLRLQDEQRSLVQARQALEEREALIHCLVDSNILGIMFWRMDGTLLDANDAFLDLVGAKREELEQGRLRRQDFTPPESLEATEAALAALQAGGRCPPYERYGLRRDGSRIPVLIGSALLPGNRELGVSFALDLSQRKAMEQELMESRQHLRELVAHGEAAMEAERKRIAREIHDEQGAVLTALKMDISLLRRDLAARTPGLGERLDAMQELVEEAVRVMRQVASQLRPVMLNLGIRPALEWLVDDFQQRHGVRCQLDGGEEFELDDSRATALFRVVQEFLTNVARHARASRVSIRLEHTPARVALYLEDDGQGFDPALVGPQSFGLLGIRERAQAFQGEVVLDSAPGKGTRLSFALPLAEGLEP